PPSPRLKPSLPPPIDPSPRLKPSPPTVFASPLPLRSSGVLSPPGEHATASVPPRPNAREPKTKRRRMRVLHQQPRGAETPRLRSEMSTLSWYREYATLARALELSEKDGLIRV